MNYRKFGLHQVNKKQQPSNIPLTAKTFENGALHEDDLQDVQKNLLNYIPENCNEIADITNTFACEIRERYRFYGVERSGSKKVMMDRLSYHKASALTVLDNFDPVGSNIESDLFLKIIKLTDFVSSTTLGLILKKLACLHNFEPRSKTYISKNSLQATNQYPGSL